MSRIKLETKPGKALIITITDAGIASFDVYVAKNIQEACNNNTCVNEEIDEFPKKLRAVKKRIIQILEEGNEVIFNEMRKRIQQEFNITENAVHKSLKELAVGGYIEEKHIVCLKK